VLIPKQIEGVEERIGASEQQVSELWLAFIIEADDLAIENATAALEVTG